MQNRSFIMMDCAQQHSGVTLQGAFDTFVETVTACDFQSVSETFVIQVFPTLLPPRRLPWTLANQSHDFSRLQQIKRLLTLSWGRGTLASKGGLSKCK